MIFSLEVRRAKKGDCFLLHFGTDEKPGLVLIDGGPRGVYKPHLKPRLLEIKEKRGLDDDTPLPVDLLMISHVDDDHIQGILDLTKEEKVKHDAEQATMLKVRRFWHNSFNAVIDNDTNEIEASFGGYFGAASMSGDGDLDEEKIKRVHSRTNIEEEEVVESSLKVLASVKQGYQLRVDAEYLQYPANPGFSRKLVLARAAPVSIPGGLSFNVIGPMEEEVEELRREHQEWLEELEREGETPPEAALAAYLDNSVANLASIVVLAEFGGKKILLTGDARGDKILEGMKRTNVLGDTGTLKVDILKVPHHGSARNLETNFFKRIIADHYVFSGDGKHGNPEREAMEMLFDARGEEPFTIHLTYPVKDIDDVRRNVWEGHDGNPRWSRAKHSLAAFFDDNLKDGQTIEIVPEDESGAPGKHLIELLDALPATSG